MSKRQLRRSVSIKATTFARLKRYCDTLERRKIATPGKTPETDGSVSHFVDVELNKALDAPGVPTVPYEEVRQEHARKWAEREASTPPPDIGSGYFTF